MNRGVLQSSQAIQVQQMMATGSPNYCWNSNMRPPVVINPQSSPFLDPSSGHLLPPYTTNPSVPLPPTSSSSSSSVLFSSSPWHDYLELPQSWSQLLLGGGVGDEEKSSMSHVQAKKMERWEEGLMLKQHAASCTVMDVNKQDNNNSANTYVYSHGEVEFQSAASTPAWSPMMPAAASSPNSCVTSLSNGVLEFSGSKAADVCRHLPPPDLSQECNSTATGGASKKARLQPPSAQSTIKVRKEKLGDRITALHQMVSPFGKTDTASVLLEAIGYVRFLQSQIEALSLPYLGSGSGNRRQKHPAQEDQNCLFPENPGQLLNDNSMKVEGTSEQESQDDQEPKRDLRSKGLCLVPISCTVQVGSDNGADYWAPAAFGTGFS